MYIAIFGTLFDFIDIVIGIDYIYVDGDGRFLKKFNSSLGYQPLVEVALIGDVRFTNELQRRRYEAVCRIANMVFTYVVCSVASSRTAFPCSP